MGLRRRSTDVPENPDTCEYPGCRVLGEDFTFVSYAINPKTNVKGMILCPKHEAQAVKGQR